MAIFVFCSKCMATRELKNIKQSQTLIKGNCRKCGSIIVKDSSKVIIPKSIINKVQNITDEKIHIGSPQIINPTTRNIEVINETFPHSQFNSIQQIYNKSYSVIIGIDEYKEEQSLSNACNDARAINRVLKKIIDL